MICFPYKRRGCRVWRGKYSLSDSPKIYDVPLDVTTKEQAREAVRKVQREARDELFGIGRP